MGKLKVHLLYEHGGDSTPFSSGQIRLLRPLQHPSLQQHLQVTPALDYDGQNVDLVIVDRLWRPDISLDLLAELLTKVEQAGAKLIYALDDNFLDLYADDEKDALAENKLRAIEFLLKNAYGVLVTTDPLKKRLASFNKNIAVIPHALDERLLPSNIPRKRAVRFFRRLRRYCQRKLWPHQHKMIIGCMGTPTHDKDLEMIVPALQIIGQTYGKKIELHLLGMVKQVANLADRTGISTQIINLRPALTDYLEFIPWFCTYLEWDIALAPLRDTPFNRCKSDIKFLDYSALGVAGIYSRVPAYETSIQHLQTGWLAENCQESWVDAVETLLNEAPLRHSIARNAARNLYDHRTLANRAVDWLRALERLLA